MKNFTSLGYLSPSKTKQTENSNPQTFDEKVSIQLKRHKRQKLRHNILFNWVQTRRKFQNVIPTFIPEDLSLFPGEGFS